MLQLKLAFLIGSVFICTESSFLPTGPIQIGILDHSEKSVQSIDLSFVRGYETEFTGQNREDAQIRKLSDRLLLYLDSLETGLEKEDQSNIFLDRQTRDALSGSILDEGEPTTFRDFFSQQCKEVKILSICIVKFLNKIKAPISENSSSEFLEKLLIFIDNGPRTRIVTRIKEIIEKKENTTVTDVKAYLKSVMEERRSEEVFLNDSPKTSTNTIDSFEELGTALESLQTSIKTQHEAITLNMGDIDKLEVEQEKDAEFNTLQTKLSVIAYLDSVLNLFDPKMTYLSEGHFYVVDTLEKSENDELIVNYVKISQVLPGEQTNPYVFKHTSDCCLLSAPKAVKIELDKETKYVQLELCDRKKDFYVCPKARLEPLCTDCFEQVTCPISGNTMINDRTLFTYSEKDVILGVHSLLAHHHYVITSKNDVSFKINEEVVHLKGNHDLTTSFAVTEHEYDQTLADSFCSTSPDLELSLGIMNAVLVGLAYLVVTVMGLICACRCCCQKSTEVPVNQPPPAQIAHAPGNNPRNRHVNWEDQAAVELRPLNR